MAACQPRRPPVRCGFPSRKTRPGDRRLPPREAGGPLVALTPTPESTLLAPPPSPKSRARLTASGPHPFNTLPVPLIQTLADDSANGGEEGEEAEAEEGTGGGGEGLKGLKGALAVPS